MAIRITCINKANGYHQDPHVAISRLGWLEDGTGKTGNWERLKLYDWLKTQNGAAYVLDRSGNRASVHPRENAAGTKYVQTVTDRVWSDNLLSLPECKS